MTAVFCALYVSAIYNMSPSRKDSPCSLESMQNKLDIGSMEQLLKDHVQQTEWGSVSFYDFHSTTHSMTRMHTFHTVPRLTFVSRAMSIQHHPSALLAATITTTLSNEVFREDPTTLLFESDMASSLQPCRISLRNHRHHGKSIGSSGSAHPTTSCDSHSLTFTYRRE